MTENELYQELTTRNLSLGDACEMIYNKTKVYIQPRHIKTRFERYRALSGTQAVAFRLFFMVIDNGKIRR